LISTRKGYVIVSGLTFCKSVWSPRPNYVS